MECIGELTEDIIVCGKYHSMWTYSAYMEYWNYDIQVGKCNKIITVISSVIYDDSVLYVEHDDLVIYVEHGMSIKNIACRIQLRYMYIGMTIMTNMSRIYIVEIYIGYIGYSIYRIQYIYTNI